MSKIKILGLALMLSMPASSLYAQQTFESGGLGGLNEVTEGPNAGAESVAACEAKEVGDACSYDMSVNTGVQTVTGTCKKWEPFGNGDGQLTAIKCE